MKLAALLSIAFAIAACRSNRSPISVAVVFPSPWKLAGQTLTDSETTIVKAAAFDTAHGAFEGFAVRFAETAAGDRTIRVEETPYSSTMKIGVAGLTYPAALASSVRFDVLLALELAAAGCQDLDRCSKTRIEILEGLGRGIGATAAHELGHQAGFRVAFARDSRCDDCYDSRTSTSYAHFFGRKHWSPEALELMKRALPR